MNEFVYVPVIFGGPLGVWVADADGGAVSASPTGPLDVVGVGPGVSRLCVTAELLERGPGRDRVRLPNARACWVTPGPERRLTPVRGFPPKARRTRATSWPRPRGDTDPGTAVPA